jgi:hypothetical protein
MSSALRALLVVSVTLLAACNDVVTIDDVITESAATRDDRILGDWVEIGGTDRARVTRGAANDYLVLYAGSEDTMAFRGRLGRLGSMQVIDVFPDEKMWSERDEAGIPAHRVYAIEITADSIAIRGLRSDSVLPRLPNSQPYSKANGDLVLHGDASGVRAVMARLFQQPAVMEKQSWYRRQR